MKYNNGVYQTLFVNKSIEKILNELKELKKKG